MSVKGVVIGVDGGGTKTKTVCMDIETRKVLSESTTGCTNWNSVGTDAAKQHLFEGIESVLKLSNVSKENIKAIGLGMSGVDRPEDVQKVKGWIREYSSTLENVSVSSDAHAALASGTRGVLYGVVVISGTGTICYGFTKDGKDKRAAGWGPLLGDEGSGCAIGHDILRAVVRAADGRGDKTALLDAVLSQLNLEKPTQLIPWAYNEKDQGWQKFAALAPLASKCAQEGDKVAQSILEHAAFALFESISAVVKGLNMESEEFPLVLAGGNLTHADSKLAALLSDKLKKEFPKAQITLPSVEIAEAGALLAINIFHL